MNIGVLASGELGLSTIKSCEAFFTPLFIATDNGSKSIINYAEQNNIPLYKGNPRGGNLKIFLGDFDIKAVLSINYLFLLDDDIIDSIEYLVNFHGSLLPKYRGRTPHVWAIINNESVTGITAHLIDKDCDTGPIVLQRIIDIQSNYTGADVLKRFKAIYPEMIKEIVKMLTDDNIIALEQDNSKATYFGKRTPDDGSINWDWQKERIYNWIRAQAFPYPGAFSFIDGEKVIIDEIEFSDHGFNYLMPNGLIIEEHPHIIVKTENGAIKIKKLRGNKNLCLKDKIFKYDNK